MRRVIDVVERALDLLIRVRARSTEGGDRLVEDLLDRPAVERAVGVVVDLARQVAVIAVACGIEDGSQILQRQLPARGEAVLAV